jgi:hypothetical protein
MGLYFPLISRSPIQIVDAVICLVANLFCFVKFVGIFLEKHFLECKIIFLEKIQHLRKKKINLEKKNS